MLMKILVGVVILFELLISQQNEFYAPGEVVIRAKNGIVSFPLNIQKGGLEMIQDTVIRKFLLNHNFIELERAIPDFSPSETLTTLENGEVVRVPDFSLVFIFHFPIESNIISLCDTLRKSLGIEWAHPNLHLLTYANDPLFSQQWALSRINCNGAWNYEKGSSNVRIAIIDIGVKYDHPDLGGGFGSGFKIAGGYDYVDSDIYPYDPGTSPHGTHVAGIASALTNNNLGIAGVSGGWGFTNKGCLLFVSRVAYSTHIANAIIKSAKPVNQGGYGCRVLNLSMGLPYAPENPNPQYSYIETIVREAMIYAYKCQRNFVAAKGNQLQDLPVPYVNFPSDFEPHLVISVGATGEDDYRSSWSNYGNNIDIVAPGDNILSTWMPNGSDMYHLLSGTSMATPHVTGLAGLIWSEAQELGIPLFPEELEGIICATAYDNIPYTPLVTMMGMVGD